VTERTKLYQHIEQKYWEDYRRSVDENCPQRAARFHNGDYHVSAQSGAYENTTSYNVPQPEAALEAAQKEADEAYMTNEEVEAYRQEIRNEGLYGRKKDSGTGES
jgi:predicted membrane-bound mannosyltransferase